MHWPFRKRVDCFNGFYVVLFSLCTCLFACLFVYWWCVCICYWNFFNFTYYFLAKKCTCEKNSSQVQLSCTYMKKLDQSTPFQFCTVHLYCTLLSRWSTKLLWMNFSFFFCEFAITTQIYRRFNEDLLSSNVY